MQDRRIKIVEKRRDAERVATLRYDDGKYRDEGQHVAIGRGVKHKSREFYDAGNEMYQIIVQL